MATFEDDWIAFPHASGLIEALTTELEVRLLPGVCFAGVVPGSDIAMDYVNDECGAMAYSRVGAVFPSASFPNPDASPALMLTMASIIELGIFRGAPLNDNGEPATEEQQFEATRLQMADMKAMLDVICSYCDLHEIPVVIGSYAPIGPQGGVVGGSWTATLGAV